VARGGRVGHASLRGVVAPGGAGRNNECNDSGRTAGCQPRPTRFG
jgi:hypothetical protein